MNIKQFTILGIVGLVAFCCTGVAPAQDSQVLTAAWEPWPPYQFLDAQNRLVGLDVELSTSVAALAGYRIEFRKLPWKRHLELMRRGSVHMASGISYTDERAVFLHYSVPYRTETVNLFIRKGDAGVMPLTSLVDLIGSSLTIGVQAGYYYGELFEQLMKQPEFKNHVETVYEGDANFRKLVLKRVDGVLADPYVAAATLRSLGLTGQVEKHPVPIHSDDIHFVFSRQSVAPEVVTAFNLAIEEAQRAGTIARISNKWLQ